MSLAKAQPHQLKAGALIEDDHDGEDKLPSKRELMKLEHNIDKLPTYEVLARLYKRHSLGIWQLIAVVPWVIILTTKLI